MITAANCIVAGSSDALTLRDYDGAAGDAVSVRDATGTLDYDQGRDALKFISGANTIAGFRHGTHSLMLHSIKIASETVSDGSVNISLSDKAHI